MYLYIKALPMTLMLRLAVCIRGNLQGDGITALQVDHAVDDDRHLAGRSALPDFALSSSRLLRPLCMAYLANGLMVSATSVTGAKIILSYYQ
jgi:hypothetical protein